MPLPVALQLFTIRDALREDVEGSLARVAQIGYKYIETGPLPGKSAEESRKTCDKLGLTVFGGHWPLQVMEEDPAKAIGEAEALGCQYITCPFLPPDYRDRAGYEQAAAIFEGAAKPILAAGLKLCYHNHSFEFDPLPDQSRGIDLLLAQTSPDKVLMELDVYWVQHGNDDPVAWVNKLAGRVPLLHIKDMNNAPDRGFAEVGTGILDIPAVLQAAPAAKCEYLIIEQDTNWQGGPLESAEISYRNLTNMLTQTA